MNNLFDVFYLSIYIQKPVYASSDIRYDEFGQKILGKLPPWQSGRKGEGAVINKVTNINVLNCLT